MSRADIYYWKCDRASAFQPQPDMDRDALRMLLQPAIQEKLKDSSARLEPFSTQGNHHAWLVHHEGGHRISFLRVEAGPEEDGYMMVESHLLDCVRSELAPTPQLVAYDATRQTVPFAWQLLEYLEQPTLRHWHKLGTLNLGAISKQIGQAIADFQQVPVQGFGPFQVDVLRQTGKLVGYHQSYPDYFLLRLDEHLAILVQGGLLSEAERERILGLVREHSSLLEIERPCLVHKDTALWNLLGTPDQITAIIDWDDAVGGDPVDDIALLGCFFEETFLQEVAAGYQSIRALPVHFVPRLRLHLLRNLLFKAVIRLRGKFFERDDAFFLIDSGGNGRALRLETRQRLLNAIHRLEQASHFPAFS